MKRVQSPSSINTYMQCPRKYFFIYNLKLPTKPSIHLVRGSVAHSALENFFTLDSNAISDMKNDYRNTFQIIITELLKKYWDESKNKFNVLRMPESELEGYYVETKNMLLNWMNQFCDKIESFTAKGFSFIDSFNKLKPETEILYKDEDLMVRGYIDAIENIDGEIRLMDYKTSKNPYISDAYKTQLAIYALLYEIKHSKRPQKVGIYFLKDTEKLLDVNDELILHAKFIIEQIHASTDGFDDIVDYPKKESPLCNWGRGQCDFYEHCFKGKEIPKSK